MQGIDLNRPIVFKHASLRFFEYGEKHTNRFCRDNVLLVVFDGVLRFSEDGVPYEVFPGEYFIQRKDIYQSGDVASDAPKYLYVHFDADWTDYGERLLPRGKHDFTALSEILMKIDDASHKNQSLIDLQYLFLKLLLSLRERPTMTPVARKLSEYIEENLESIASLTDLCRELHYSKNYVIRIFNKEFGKSPIQYINDVKINKATYLLETTSRPIEEIAEKCGFSDYAYFYRRFVKKTGLSPLKWRKNVQENPLFSLSR